MVLEGSVPARGLVPDELDIAILQEMYRAGAVNLAGIDPRLNASRVAQSLGIGRARVAARLRAWRSSGFLRKYDVWPNPALLGLQGASVSVRVEHPRVKPDLIGRLALVDGVVSALEFQGEWITLSIIAPDVPSLERRAALIRSFAGVAEVEAPIPWRLPEPTRPLTPLELRIVGALRARPTATLNEIARQIGISTRTMTRKYSDLVDQLAVWFLPVFDFRAISNAVLSLNLRLRPGTERRSIAAALRAKFPLTLDGNSASVGPAFGVPDTIFFVTLSSAAQMEDLERLAESLPGVEGVELYHLVRMHEFPEWFDRQLRGLIRAAPSATDRSPPGGARNRGR